MSDKNSERTTLMADYLSPKDRAIVDAIVRISNKVDSIEEILRDISRNTSGMVYNTSHLKYERGD